MTTGDLYGIVSANYCLAYLHCLRSELGRAIPLLERALALCREREFGVWLPQVSGYLGYAYARAGRADEGLSLLERAIDVYDETRAWPFRSLLTAYRGIACMLSGRLDSALAFAQEALTLAREHGERGHEAWALHLLGEITSRNARSVSTEAQHHHRMAWALAGELGMRPLVARCRLRLGAMGTPEQREHLVAAANMCRDMAMDVWLAEAEAALASLDRA